MRTRKNIRLPNFQYRSDGFIYAITICTYEKQDFFSDTNITRIIKETLIHRNISEEIILYCFCIMSDHIHLLMSLNSDFSGSLPEWIRSFKRYTSRIIKSNCNIMRLWQRNFYDHVVRREESLHAIGEYILNNPVRRGLVDIWNEYPHSWVNDKL